MNGWSCGATAPAKLQRNGYSFNGTNAKSNIEAVIHSLP
jgi:hypothetical protein